MDPFYIVMVLGIVIIIGFVLLVNKYFHKKRIIKYIPFIITLLMGISLTFTAFYIASPYSSLGLGILGITNLIASIAALFTALMIDLINSKRTKIK